MLKNPKNPRRGAYRVRSSVGFRSAKVETKVVSEDLDELSGSRSVWHWEAADVQVIALVDRTGGFMVLRPTLACVMPVERPARVVCGVLTLS